ncbi:MAG TPA: hypothetical protein VNE39_05400 [Planctomycetota bacterium]|nr:hypothetical protein [Planctomycetota bacterium]
MGKVRRDGSKAWIEGIEPYRVIDPMFEGVRLILASRGERYSPDYIQGISGSAFRIGGICPCAPTCENAMWPQDLLRLLGYELEHVKIEGEGEALKEATRKAVARVKQEIDAGRAALVWHAFTNAEWDVVYGYDAEKKQFLGRGSYAGNDKPFAAEDEMRTGQCGDICCPAGVLLISRKTGEFDAPKAEVAALREAVRHARDQKNVDKLGGEKWVMLAGLACYDRWIRDFGKPDKKREVGDAYCYGVYRSTHAAAAGFLRETAPKHPAMADHLRRAADHFQAEAEALAKGEKLLWWNSPEGPDPKRNTAAAALLTQARDAYAAGIAEVEKALAAEGAKGGTGTPGPAAEKRLDGLKQKPMWITHMGSLIGCAEFLKSEAPPAWIYGGCGHAFALNVHEVICPSGPTAWPSERCDAFAANVGLVVERHHGGKSEKGIAEKREAIWRKTCEAIDAGTPCYGWELDVPEWYVIQGYDAEGNYLFDKFGQPGKTHHAKLGDTGIGWAVVAVVRTGKASDDRTVVREALRFALEHGAGKHSNEKWHTGLSGYDTWIKALADDRLVAEDKVIGFGNAYNAQCWAECRRYAVAFLEEARKRLADPKLALLLDEAIARYKVVSEQLGAVAKTFPFKVDDTRGMDERLRDAARRAKAIEALKAARAAEESGLKALAELAAALDASRK